MRRFSISAIAIVALLSACNDPETKKDPCLNATAPQPIDNLSKVLPVGSNRPVPANELFSSFGGKGVCLRSMQISGEPTTIQASSQGPSGITLLGEKVGLMTRLAVDAAIGGATAATSNAETTDTVGVTATNCCGLSATATVQVNLKPPVAPAPGSSTTIMTLSADSPAPSESFALLPPPATSVTREPIGRGFGHSF